MDDDESALRELVDRWVAGIQNRDVEAVVANHTDDLVMFDVPPPYDGVRGVDEYRKSWPPFFDWLACSGALFDLKELAVVTAAESPLAYGHALLRCGTPVDLTAKPAVRLRISFGFRKVDGRWLIAHEHHSFPME
jgi:uncharacterized protein (TIGR02246 family)